jgi:hypothetical protein
MGCQKMSLQNIEKKLGDPTENRPLLGQSPFSNLFRIGILHK